MPILPFPFVEGSLLYLIPSVGFLSSIRRSFINLPLLLLLLVPFFLSSAFQSNFSGPSYLIRETSFDGDVAVAGG